MFTSIKLPTELREVQYAAFFGGKLRGVSLPGKLHTIGRSAFNGNDIQRYDSNRLNIPNSVTSIEYRAFHNNWIGSLAIPNSVRTIGEQAFHENLRVAKAYANILSGDRANPLRLRGYDFTSAWSRAGASPY